MTVVLIIVSMLSVPLAITGCGARDGIAPANLSGPGVLPQARASRVSVYVAQANGASNGFVYGYGANNKANRAPLCTITGQTFDHSQIAVDDSGNAYLPNLKSSSIDIYAPNCGASLATVKDPYGADVDVALGGNGTFYGAGGAHVSVCTMAGCKRELTDPSIFQLETAAVDPSGNVWASYYNQKGAPSLIVWPGASMPGKPVSGYVNQNTPGDLAFDQHATLISLRTLFPDVYLYRCVAATATCTNTKLIRLHSGSVFGAINASNTDYQVTEYPNNGVDVYSYPSFTFKYSYNRGLKQGFSTQGIAQTL
jgi:hypothetical protein